MHLIRLHNNEDHPFLLTLAGFGEKAVCTLRSGLTYKKVTSKDYEIPIAKDLEGIGNYYRYKVCCGDGLVLLIKVITSEMLLWNPFLGKTRKIPPICSDNTKAAFGLGFDTVRKDYKVVAIRKHPRVSVEIYKLSSPFWTTITNCNCEESIIRKVDSNGVLMEGTVHWIAQSSGYIPSHMVLFDVNNEVFNYIMLPKNLRGYLDQKHPILYRGKVGLLHVVRNHLCSLWVTENDQAQGSWVKLYEVNLGIVGLRGIPYRHRFHVLSFKKNGQLIFARTQRNGVKLYDFESQETKQLLKTFSHVTMYSTPYKGSLVLI